jgi:predicted small secreted protein
MTWRNGVGMLIRRCGRAGAVSTWLRVDIANRHAVNRLVTSLVVTSLLVTGLLAGCSTTDGVGPFIVDPGRYSVYHCDGLQTRLKVLLAREDELNNLMQKASEGGGGVLIGNMSYRADYEKTLGEEKLLRRTAAEKKCELPPPAVAASPTPTAYSTQPPPAAYTAPSPPAGAPVFQSDQTIR